MSNDFSGRIVDAAELRRLGYPENVIKSVAARAERGIFSIEPPAEVAERTIELCRGLFPSE